MPAFLSDALFVRWFVSLKRLNQNPIIKWWVESQFPWDWLAFLDDGPYLNTVRVNGVEVLLAWMSIGTVQIGAQPKESFLKSYNNPILKLPRWRKITGFTLLVIYAIGLPYAIARFDDAWITPFAYLNPIVASIALAAIDYHDLYNRLVRGRKLSVIYGLKRYLLVPLIMTGFSFGTMALGFLGIGIGFTGLDLTNYSIIQKMATHIAVFIGTCAAMLLVFEIHLRACLRLIEQKLAY
jgi:hypothetical protein